MYTLFFLVVAAIILLAFGKLGRDTHGSRTATGLWCWIKITNNDDVIHSTDTVIMFMSGKLWELITYVLSFYVYMMLKLNTYLEVIDRIQFLLQKIFLSFYYCQPSKTNVNLGFASVDIGFLGMTMSHITLLRSQYLYNIAV